MAVRNLSYAAATTISIPTGENGVQRLGIEVSNNSGGALTTFVLSARVGKSTTFITLASDAAGFSTPVAPLIRTVGAPVTLANGASALILLDCHGLSKVRVVASAAVSVEASLG